MLPNLLGFKNYLIGGGIGLTIGFAFGFGTGYHLVSVQFAQYKAAVKAMGEAQEKAAKEKERKDELLRKQLEQQRKKAEEDRRKRFADLYERYHSLLNDSGSSPVPSAAASSTEPMHKVCFDHDGYRSAVGSFVEGALRLAEKGASAVDDSRWWGEWARRIDACANIDK